MFKKSLFLMSSVLLLAVAVPLCSAAIGPVTSVTTDNPPGTPPYNLLSITVGGYTVPVSGLSVGTSTTTLDPVVGTALPLIDNFEIYNTYNSGEPTGQFTVYMFGGKLWTNNNGDNPDFFVFEGGGNDSPMMAAILEGGAIGQAVNIGGNWGNLGAGYQAVNNQQLHGVSFAITDLLDAAGNPLTNNSTIEGLAITSRNGLDPSCLCAVASNPRDPSNPSPAHLAVDVPVDANLSWRRGDGAVVDEVYFGTDPCALPLVITILAPAYPPLYDPPGDLIACTTYYWQIVEVNGLDRYEGDIWEFTSISGAAQ
ncbi:MAG: hypothetical protein ACYTA5_26400, partial [Planctomycetota bacterium]